MRVTPEGFLQHIYYGSPLSNPLEVEPHFGRTFRGTASTFEDQPYFSLNELPQEYPTFGRSDYRVPAFHGLNSHGNSVFSLHYKSHHIVAEKPVLTGLPSARGGESQTLIITMEDTLHGLEVDLSYTIWTDHGVLARSAKFRNCSDKAILLQNVYSTALNVPSSDYEILHLHGTWSREFNEERIKMPMGRIVIDSSRGTSSAAHNPFMVILEKGAGEDHGHIYATSLVYSGNFSISAEAGEFEDVRILAGINPIGFMWNLASGDNFSTPEALHVFSDKGLRTMSHRWHEFVRDKISPPQFRQASRPTYFNTWEAAYFDIDENKVLTLADKAQELSIDMLVVDDGWFQGRQNDMSSLGDWTPDEDRFPTGIASLAKKVKDKGLKFGLWFEPEMVSVNSRLFEQNPDWILHIPGRKPSLGRHQLTLDLSRDEVVAHIYKQMDVILSCGHIDYVKWDMNRNMTELGSAAWPANQQSEISHRYILGLYKLLERLTDRYPDILFENCASGGNRFDLGMLSYMPQGWVSDMCDPIGRLDIINGASYLYPLDVMAAYIGPSPNHQNGRMTSLQTRFHAGLFCAARGLSLNEEDIDLNKDELMSYMSLAKSTAQDMVGGRFDRLIKNNNEVCWQYQTHNKSRVYLLYFHILSSPNQPFKHIRLTGLDKKAEYRLNTDGKIYFGDALMSHGLMLPYVNMLHVDPNIQYMPQGDFSSSLFIFERTG